jgi:hypothetical protein
MNIAPVCQPVFDLAFANDSAGSKKSAPAAIVRPRADVFIPEAYSDAFVKQSLAIDSLQQQLTSGSLWVVNSRRRNGIIIYREFHAEFAGPGAAVGGELDSSCQKFIPLGNLSLVKPASSEELQKALKIRLQWIRLTQNFTDQPSSTDRAQMILEQFKTYFDQSTVDQVTDDAFARLVGVLPQTIRQVRSGVGGAQSV